MAGNDERVMVLPENNVVSCECKKLCGISNFWLGYDKLTTANTKNIKTAWENGQRPEPIRVQLAL